MILKDGSGAKVGAGLGTAADYNPPVPANIVKTYVIPFCPVHRCKMHVGSTGAVKRYFYCTEPGCKESKAFAK